MFVAVTQGWTSCIIWSSSRCLAIIATAMDRVLTIFLDFIFTTLGKVKGFVTKGSRRTLLSFISTLHFSSRKIVNYWRVSITRGNLALFTGSIGFWFNFLLDPTGFFLKF